MGRSLLHSPELLLLYQIPASRNDTLLASQPQPMRRGMCRITKQTAITFRTDVDDIKCQEFYDAYCHPATASLRWHQRCQLLIADAATDQP
jgi:hypothetical protein